MLSFISAVYNEEAELDDLLKHVVDYVSFISIMDDVSTDLTPEILQDWWEMINVTDVPVNFNWHQMEEHSGLPETVKAAALDVVPDGSWVLMLDADERFAEGVLEAIASNLADLDSRGITHVYFQQLEIIDNRHVRTFQKAKLFKKEAVHFPTNDIHADDRFDGEGEYKPEWIVYHRKTTNKQILREEEYLETYKRLLDDGKITPGRYEWLKGLHHYVRS